MVYFITGSNVFGQWLCDDAVLSKFRQFKAIKHDLGIGLLQAKLLQISWSYNIFEADDVFYVTGTWHGKEDQLVRIPLPEECSGANVQLSVIGNDYKILLIGKNVNKLWVLDLKTNNIKKIPFYVEEPHDHNTGKKQKKDNSVIKAEISNDSCTFLTSNGNVYCGLLPSYVDTSHCKGKVIDVKCGYEHFIILTDYGTVYTWGNGRRLQLGHGDITSTELPTEIDALAGIKIIKISAGGWHSLALSEFGDLYAWGWNDTGQLGIKNVSTESYSIPTLIDLFDEQETVVEKNTKDIACGSRHSAILLEDNTVWTTGCNKYGQLGLSEEKYPTLNHFRKVFNCNNDCSLMCGPWNTVIICSSQTAT
ncbi:hypothetical protein PYW07_014272 [Mythimna separata]|uniref:RCC1 domain-containing protein 1 n=1 Tax=Mythimna separata TaxID=271217 RepID=A0AAD8DZX1_MYTSE|nr:hypothetical protein PYW07_014272 [Mythimna separata]